MPEPIRNVRLHRFRQEVAITMDGFPTVYLSAHLAKGLAHMLIVYADDCTRTRFSESILHGETLIDPA